MSPSSKVMIWIGWILGVLPSLLLFFSAAMKLGNGADVAEMFNHLGFPPHLALTLGIVEIGCTVIYLIPRTSVLGAILLTGYLGGAIATHARILEIQFLGPLVLGLMIWGGLFLRDSRLREVIPIRK
jgi:hypothetical protein